MRAREFSNAIADPTGIFGIGQWAPGTGLSAQIGPAETEFVTAYTQRTGTRPDYPAVQAVAAAVLATHCAQLAGGTTRELLWAAAASLDTMTLFGRFRLRPMVSNAGTNLRSSSGLPTICTSS